MYSQVSSSNSARGLKFIAVVSVHPPIKGGGGKPPQASVRENAMVLLAGLMSG